MQERHQHAKASGVKVGFELAAEGIQFCVLNTFPRTGNVKPESNLINAIQRHGCGYYEQKRADSLVYWPAYGNAFSLVSDFEQVETFLDN